MKEKIESIAKKIKLKLHNDTSSKEKIDSFIADIQESKPKTTECCVHFLLKVAAGQNMLDEVHNLLELNMLKNIDQPLRFEKKEPVSYLSSDHGKTLLGIAAFNGHLGLVKYLTEVRLANVNSQDSHGDTPLHQVVYGDSYPFNHASYGRDHGAVAKYLLQCEGDLTIKNTKGNTAYDCTKGCAPLFVENWVGRRFITNTGSAFYYADKVRPVFEKELKRLAEAQRDPSVFIFRNRITEPTKYTQFRLEYAIKEYVKKGIVSETYPNFQEFLRILDHLSEEEWKHLEHVLKGQEPAPYSFKYGLIVDQLPKITKQSICLALLVSVATYYYTQNIILAGLVGPLCGAFVWQCLTAWACRAEEAKREVQETRVSDLLKHDRFFKPASVHTLSSDQLKNFKSTLKTSTDHGDLNDPRDNEGKVNMLQTFSIKNK